MNFYSSNKQALYVQRSRFVPVAFKPGTCSPPATITIMCLWMTMIGSTFGGSLWLCVVVIHRHRCRHRRGIQSPVAPLPSSSLTLSLSSSSSLSPITIVIVVVSRRVAAYCAIAVAIVIVVAIIDVVIVVTRHVARRAVATDIVVVVARCHRRRRRILLPRCPSRHSRCHRHRCRRRRCRCCHRLSCHRHQRRICCPSHHRHWSRCRRRPSPSSYPVAPSPVAPLPSSLSSPVTIVIVVAIIVHLRRLVVASPTILTCRRLSCRAGWLSSCCLSLCTVVSLFTTSLIALPSLWVIDTLNPSKKRIVCSGGLPLSIRQSGTGRKASCGALKGNIRRRRPRWWCLFLAVGSCQHTSTFGIVHIFYRIKNVLGLLDSLKFRRHVRTPPIKFTVETGG